ncbi:MAG: hypothetical protein IJH39_06375 [Clostridia bacterium]|nr:hypothetical protein [Clostridia bacterium]
MDNDNLTSYSARLTKTRKQQLQSIIDELNEQREPNEPKKTLKYIHEYFISSYKNEPNFNLKIRLLDLENEIKEIRELIETQEIILTKKENELKEIQSQLNNESLDNYNKKETKQVNLTPKLEKAVNNLIGTCKQRNINNFDKIPIEMFTAVSGSFEVKKTDLIRYVKNNFESLINEIA